MSPKNLPVAASLALMTLVGLTSRDAHAQACGMGEVDFYGTERAAVSRAEGLLENGEPQKAAAILQHMWPHLREAVPVASSVPVIAYGVRLMALAVVRADGNVPSDLGWSSWTAGERAGNVAWGIRRLRMLAAADPDNPSVKTDLGEALSRAPATREEARVMLEALDHVNGVTSPEGYAALSLVRSAVGDVTGAELATSDCQRHALNVMQQCASGVQASPSLTALR